MTGHRHDSLHLGSGHGQAHGAPGQFPVLDIGGEVGALIVYLAALPATGELHACPVDSPVVHRAFHTGVHHRHLDDEVVWMAIYPEVAEGSYHLLDDDGLPMAQVAVSGGQVHQLDLR